MNTFIYGRGGYVSPSYDKLEKLLFDVQQEVHFGQPSPTAIIELEDNHYQPIYIMTWDEACLKLITQKWVKENLSTARTPYPVAEGTVHSFGIYAPNYEIASMIRALVRMDKLWLGTRDDGTIRAYGPYGGFGRQELAEE